MNERGVFTFALQIADPAERAASRDGKTLAATTGQHDSGRLFVWHVASGKEVAAQTGHIHNVHALSLHPAGRLAATGSWDGTVRVWDVPTGRSRVFDSGRGMKSQFDGVAFTPEGRYLVVGSSFGIVCIWKTPKFPAVAPDDPGR